MTLLYLTPAGIHGQTLTSYHAHPSLSHSLCKYLEPEVAPSQFWHHSWMNQHRPTQAFKGAHIHTGNLLHAAMEDYESFQASVEVLHEVKRTSRPGCIGRDQLEALMVLRAKLLAMPVIQQAIAEGHPEVSYYAHQHGVPIRCRPDWDSPSVELHWKFISRMDYLGSFIERMRYIECLAWYRRVRRALGLPDRRQIMYLCQTYAPYEIRTVEPSAYWLDEKELYGHMAITRFKRLLNDLGGERWPDFQQPVDIYTSERGGGLGAIKMSHQFEKGFAA